MKVYGSPYRILNKHARHILQMLLIIQGQLQSQNPKQNQGYAQTKNRKGSSKQCIFECNIRFVLHKGAEQSNIEIEPVDVFIIITVLYLIHIRGFEP